jgi:hypothetical protein
MKTSIIRGAAGQQALGGSGYNTRLQPVGMSLGSTKGAIDRWRIDLDYGLIGTSNGNIFGQRIRVPGADVQQRYDYDVFNRLKVAHEQGSAGAQTCAAASVQLQLLDAS